MIDKLLSDGFYVGKLSNIFSDDKINEIKRYRDSVLDFYDNNQDLVMCRFTMNPHHYNFDNFPHDYVQDISVSEIESRFNLIKSEDFKVAQKWQWFNMEGEYESTNQFFKNITKDIFDYYYPNREIDYKNTSEQFTVLEDGDFIEEHMDGYSENRVCVTLIYLSDSIDYKGGGRLEIKKDNKFIDSIEPTFGNFVVLDFTKHNITHLVTPVVGNFKRLSYTSFINQM